MIPLELEVVGLHSYRDRVRIPFDKLTENRLFGIFGPTGSGKSSLLDAITLALYGTVDRFGGNEITPVLHTDAKELEVVFRFRLGGTTYRARRRFMRKGDGAATQRDSELEDETNGRVLASQAREMGQAVQDLLGMDFEKFTRAVFLPQGKFAQFLKDGPTDRLELLEDLFGLQRFGDQLRTRVRRRLAAVKEEHDQLQGALSGLDAYDQELVDQLDEQVESLAEKVASLEARRTELATQLDAARRLQQELDRRTTLQATLETLEARAGEVRLRRQQLEASKAAQGLLSLLAELQEKRAGHRALQETGADLEAALADLEAEADAFEAVRDEREETLSTRQRSLQTLQQRLEGLRDQAAVWGHLEAEKREVERQLQDGGDEPHRPLPADLSLEARELRALDQWAAEGRRRCQSVADLSDRADRTREDLEDRTQTLETKEAELETVRKQHRAAEANVAALEEGLRRAQVEQQAQLLADHLSAGEPCPVCGSREHPDPAQVTDGDGSSLRDRLERCRRQERSLDQRVQTLTGEIRTANQELSRRKLEHLSVTEDLQTARATLQDHVEQPPVPLPEDLLAERDWAQLQQDCQQWTTHLERRDLEAQLKDLSQRLTRFQAVWRESREQLGLPPSPLDPSSVDRTLAQVRERIGATGDELEQLEADEKALKERLDDRRYRHGQVEARLEERQTELDRLAARFEQALAQSPFNAEAAVEAAAMLPDEQQALSKAIETHEARVRETQGGLKLVEAALAEIDLEPSEAQEVLTENEQVQQTLEETRERLATVRERRRGAGEKLAKRREVEQALGDLTQRVQRLETLKKLFHGQAFVEYLARTRFDQVLEQASRRLAQISNGQYHLKGDPREIRVVDLLSGGAQRDLRSVSGGERFMVSLSLALALSDAIQNERGGGYASIEFFFLDEGFGSLDGQTLEAVMHLLQDLAEQGIRVGFITHVEAAKRYVPAHLEVERATEARGSRVQVRH